VVEVLAIGEEYRMYRNISELDDRSAAGILKAADEGVIASDVRNKPIIEEARALVKEGKGDFTYDIGINREWRPSTEE
jgi:hypothetical protein